jgi:hypothetical protein
MVGLRKSGGVLSTALSGVWNGALLVGTGACTLLGPEGSASGRVGRCVSGRFLGLLAEPAVAGDGGVPTVC